MGIQDENHLLHKWFIRFPEEYLFNNRDGIQYLA